MNSIFIPYLNELRGSEQFEACEAVLLMDNCSPHMSDDVIAVLHNARLTVIIFAPHTTFRSDEIIAHRLRQGPCAAQNSRDERAILGTVKNHWENVLINLERLSRNIQFPRSRVESISFPSQMIGYAMR
jgi:hypothetical protein